VEKRGKGEEERRKREERRREKKGEEGRNAQESGIAITTFAEADTTIGCGTTKSRGYLWRGHMEVPSVGQYSSEAVRSPTWIFHRPKVQPKDRPRPRIVRSGEPVQWKGGRRELQKGENEKRERDSDMGELL